MDEYKVAIVGAGFSGLFCASQLKKKGMNSFVLIEKAPINLGGCASLGGAKVGFLPAGQRTAHYLSQTIYEKHSNAFEYKYGTYFSFEEKLNSSFNFNVTGLENKYYRSPIIEKDQLKKISDHLMSENNGNCMFSPVVSIDKTQSERYILHLLNNETIQCEVLIIASGRDESITKCLIGLNEKFHEKQELIIGCRACFKPETAIELFKHQHDFKIKAPSKFQTYCFNYKGRIHKLRYMERDLFFGSFDKNSEIGNTFIGKKIIGNTENAIGLFPNINILNSMDFNKSLKFIDDLKYKSDFIKFVEMLNDNFKIEFTSFHFPALEQFWPRPILKNNSLASKNLKNVYYLGDASGIAFGLLQCYITANHLLQRFDIK